MIALIAGATGVVGRELTRLLLADPAYGQVIVLVRRKGLLPASERLQEIVFDFETMTPTLPRADRVFCCLGTTMAKAGSREAFSRVDHDYVLQLAQAAREVGTPVFACISAVGADPRSSVFYNRVKGQTEQDLRALTFPSLGLFRPSMLLGTRNERRPMERAGQVIMQALRALIPDRYKAVHAAQVAEAMRRFAAQPAPGATVFENPELIRC